MEPGASARERVTVTEENTARAMGSGSLPVFATPALAALMEKAACAAIAPALEAGQTSVGALLTLRHTAASPLGETVECEAVLTALEGRKLTFTLRAWDSCGAVGEAEHERVLVDGEKFVRRALEKRGG